MLAPPEPALLKAIANGSFPELIHPLCGHLGKMEAPDWSRIAQGRELRAYFSRALAGPITPDSLLTALCEANATLPGCSGKIRTAETGLTPNATGIQVYFPPANTVSPQIEAIARFIARSTVQGEDPLLAAIGTLGLLLNCHPFADGNGRVSRALYDHLLHRAGSREFFPLYPLLFAARRSFDLALREAEIKGDWSPFVIHNCQLIAITANWPRDEAARKHTALHGAHR